MNNQIKWAVWIIAGGVVVLVVAPVVIPALEERQATEDLITQYCIGDAFSDQPEYDSYEECEEHARFLIDVGLLEP